jgi:hypothetical protein
MKKNLWALLKEDLKVWAWMAASALFLWWAMH